jgi:hypothetical protein
VGLPIGVVALCVAVAIAVLRSPTVSVEIGEPNDRVGVVRFANGRVDLRSGPGLESEVINFLPPALGVLVGEPDANGWVAVLDPVGDTVGFVDAASMTDLPPPTPGRHFELEGLVVPVR